MGDLWLIRQEDEEGRRYLLEHGALEAWVDDPRDAATFKNAQARNVARELGPRPGLEVVRRFKELVG
jgi:hypothetical protein